MTRPDFTTASRQEMSAYAMVLEMMNNNQAITIQEQGEAIQQQAEQISAMQDTIKKAEQALEDLK